MDSGSSATFGLMGLWVIFQLAFVLVIVLGGIYALYCLNRAASGLDRMAAVAETWLAHQLHLEQQKQRAEAEAKKAATIANSTVTPETSVTWHHESTPPN